jgi:hypothetical protein
MRFPQAPSYSRAADGVDLALPSHPEHRAVWLSTPIDR